MRRLRALPAYRALRDTAPEDYRRVEIDYVEIAFSARRYREADSLASAFLSPATREPTNRLNAALFAYMASVMAGDTALARARLARLEGEVRALPDQFSNNWTYPGTEAFIKRSDLPDPLKKALLELCRGGLWYSRSERERVIAENRRALGVLARPGATGRD
jgi:hypothetical protein